MFGFDLETIGQALMAYGILLTLAQLRVRKVGGIHFARYGRLCFSFCLSRKS